MFLLWLMAGYSIGVITGVYVGMKMAKEIAAREQRSRSMPKKAKSARQTDSE